MNRKALMEAALARRVRNHRGFRQAGLHIEVPEDGGIRTVQHGKIIGVCTWRDGGFEFLLDSKRVVRIATIHGVVLHLATLLNPSPLEQIDCRSLRNPN